jgi:hypothetical protein
MILPQTITAWAAHIARRLINRWWSRPPYVAAGCSAIKR